MSTVRVNGLGKSYGERAVLTDLDLTVQRGSLTAVLGVSGCGKSTLLRIIAGFVRPDHGSVSVGGTVVSGPGVHVRPQSRGVGYVPQEGALFPHLDVRRNILFSLPRAERSRARLDELLDLTELPHEIAGRFPHELSGGQQQRVALARALAAEPAVILLDEPFSSLDTSLRSSAGRTVARVLRAAGTTALLVTHDQGEALSLADEVAVMRVGRFVQVAEPARLYDRPADVEVARFIGGGSVLDATVGDGHATCELGTLRLAEELPDGPAQVLLRPEQVELVQHGVPARVREVDYFGSQVVVVLELPSGARVTARGPARRPPVPGAYTHVRSVGAVHAFPAAPEVS